MNELSDERLVKETLEGNNDAFSILVKRHKGQVFRISARFAQSNTEIGAWLWRGYGHPVQIGINGYKMQTSQAQSGPVSYILP